MTIFCLSALLFEFFQPLITSSAIQYANGSDGRRRHRVFTETFSAKSSVSLLPAMNSICKEFADNWARLPPEEHVPLFDYMMALAIKNITRWDTFGFSATC